jgi:hypothetical protein
MKKKRQKANPVRDRKAPAAELENLRQRALARAVLEDTSCGPDISISFAKEGGREADEPHSATVQCEGMPDREFIRNPSETTSDFEARVNRSAPVVGSPLIIFWPEPDEK